MYSMSMDELQNANHVPIVRGGAHNTRVLQLRGCATVATDLVYAAVLIIVLMHDNNILQYYNMRTVRACAYYVQTGIEKSFCHPISFGR